MQVARNLNKIPYKFDWDEPVDKSENNMPACVVHPSQLSQFDSQPLSQHVSQTSELSFGGGAPLHASTSASMPALHSTKSMNGSHVDHDPINASEHQEDPDDDDDNDDGDDSQAPLEVCQLPLLG